MSAAWPMRRVSLSVVLALPQFRCDSFGNHDDQGEERRCGNQRTVCGSGRGSDLFHVPILTYGAIKKPRLSPRVRDIDESYGTGSSSGGRSYPSSGRNSYRGCLCRRSRPWSDGGSGTST